jgi:HEPN domain-containing protein
MSVEKYRKESVRWVYIPTRYPNGLPDSIPAEIYTPDDAREAIRSARELLDEIMGAMGGA